MATLTKIQQQRKRSDRYSLYIDGRYRFSLSVDQLAESNLKVGQEFDEADLEQWLRASQDGKLLDKLYRFLSYRDRSVQEAREYLLRRQEADPDTAEQLLERLMEQGVLDDQRFARAWLRDRTEVQGYSLRRIQQELRRKGINSQTIEHVFAELDPDTERDTLARLIENKQLQRRYPDERKLIAYLAGQGYSYSLIKDTLAAL